MISYTALETSSCMLYMCEQSAVVKGEEKTFKNNIKAWIIVDVGVEWRRPTLHCILYGRVAYAI